MTCLCVVTLGTRMASGRCRLCIIGLRRLIVLAIALTLGCGEMRSQRWVLEAFILFVSSCRAFGEKVLMYVASFRACFGLVALQPIVIGLKRAQIDGVPDQCWLHKVVDVSLY